MGSVYMQKGPLLACHVEPGGASVSLSVNEDPVRTVMKSKVLTID